MTVCAWCEGDLDERDRQTIRFSTSQPPWKVRGGLGYAGAVRSVGFSFANALRAAGGEPDVTVWFHRPCWHELRKLLKPAPPDLE